MLTPKAFSLHTRKLARIILYVYDELSFNSMHPHPERTWRLGMAHADQNGNVRKEFKAPGDWARRLKENRPEVQQTLRVL